MITLTRTADHALREDLRAFVTAEAADWHRRHLGRLYQLWEEWNAAHFAGKLIPPYVLLTPPESPRAYGDCANISSFGGCCQIRIRPSLLMGTHPHMRAGDVYAEGRFQFVADVLLHETIHQWHFEVTGQNEDSYHGHGPAFAQVCNAIGVALSLPPVRSMKRRGKDKDLPSCAQWPHVVRPAGFYAGAYVRGQARPAGSGDEGEDEELSAPINALADLIDQALAGLDAGDVSIARRVLAELRRHV